MEESINIQSVFQALKKRFWIIALITILMTTLAAVVSYFFITPIYQAKTEIIVNQSKDAQQIYSSNEVQTNLQLVTTYSGIIKSPVVLEKVKENLKLENEQSSGLKDNIFVQNEKNSQIITIVVENIEPSLAVDIANEVASVFQSELVNIMNIDNVSILAKADLQDTISPVKPRPTINILLAFIIGSMLGSAVAFLIEYLDNTIKTEADIEKLLQQSVLGVVSTHNVSNEKKFNPEFEQSHRKVRSDTIGS